MQTHNLVQGSDEWHIFRSLHFGASEAAAMLGLSKKMTRNELIQIKRGLTAKEFSDWVQKYILDKGHDVEAMARPLIEERIGKELYPVTCSDGELSASCDGLTMDETIAFEHKQWNSELAKSVGEGILPDEHWPQCQQILMITSAQKLLFTVSDGTIDNLVCLEVFPDKEKFELLRNGWEQFKKDVEAYEHIEAKPEVVGKAPDSLPALHIEVSGSVIASNLAEFKTNAIAVFKGINTDLQSDEDFANAEKTVKWCKDIEDRLEGSKQHALSQTASIDELFRTMDAIKEEARQVRLSLDKTIKQRKEDIRMEMIEYAQFKFKAFEQELQAEIPEATLRIVRPDFIAAIKGLKTKASIQNALDTETATAKIGASALAKIYRTNIAWAKENATDFNFLFANDLSAIVAKDHEDFKNLIQSRIHQFQEQEAKKAEVQKPQEKVPDPKTGDPVASKHSVSNEDMDLIAEFIKSREWQNAASKNTARAILVEFMKFQEAYLEAA